MIKKITITPAPKRNTMSISNTVKPEAKNMPEAKIKTVVKTRHVAKIHANAGPKPNIAAMPAKKMNEIKPITPHDSLKASPRPVVQKKIPSPKISKPVFKKSREDGLKLEMPLEHDAYFVYLKNPLEYRKYLLECSKRILFCLRSYQRLLLIRQKKLEGIGRLHTCVKELLYINKKFNEKLPKYNTALFENQPERMQIKSGTIQARAVSKKSSAAPVSKDPAREKTELEKLEESLANIESKLRNLQ